MAKYDELKSRAEELGIPLNSGVYKSNTERVNELQITEYELHRRIRNEERHRREHCMWIVAVIAAGIALLAAIAAWVPIFLKTPH